MMWLSGLSDGPNAAEASMPRLTSAEPLRGFDEIPRRENTSWLS
jgi:hypothetical protein